VVTDVPKRRASVAGGSPSAMQGPEPVVVDNGGAGVYDDDDSTMPATPEMLRQTSEQELLKTAGSLGVVRALTKRLGFFGQSKGKGRWGALFQDSNLTPKLCS